jgi:hypothetical protein
MKDSKKSSSFEEAKNPDLESGALKFSTDYVSKSKLFEVVSQWVQDDPNVLNASIRSGGGSQIAMDFRYDSSGAPEEEKGGNILRKKLVPYFEEKLGGDFIVGWDYADNTIVIK